MPRFSLIAPLFNEEVNVRTLYERLVPIAEQLCARESLATDDFEIILVDDGSRDSTWRLITGLCSQDLRVKGVRLSRNFGHYNAITAGIDTSRGDIVVLMDGDLQDPPEEILKIHSEYLKGFDHVYSVRDHRADSFSRRVFSSSFWFLFKRIAKIPITENQSMLRMMSRRYADCYRRFSEKSRFLAGIFAWMGFRQSAVLIHHASRHAGSSKYTLWKMLKLTINAITSFTYFPLQIAGMLGTFIALISFCGGGIILIRKMFFGIDVEGWTSLIVTILFIGGIQLAFLGLIGEYLGRIFVEVQNRPLYLIQEAHNIDTEILPDGRR